jgi:hypothetical protein
MKGTTRYFILKRTPGRLDKKSSSNTHLFFIPVDPHHYMYIGLIGQLTDEERTYAAQLFVKLPEDLLDETINGELEYFGERLEDMEDLNCTSFVSSPGKYIIQFPRTGNNIKSDLELVYQTEYSSSDRKIYFVKGDLNLVMGDIEEDESDISQIAARQKRIVMGDSKNKKRKLHEVIYILNDRKMFEISCKEELMNIVRESEIVNKSISPWQKKDLYVYIKNMNQKEVASLLFNEGMKTAIGGGGAIAIAAGAAYLYRKLLDPCVRRYPLNSLARHTCQLEAIKQVMEKIESDKSKCSNAVNPEICNEKLNKVMDTWRAKYEKQLVKIAKSRGKKFPYSEKLKNAKL